MDSKFNFFMFCLLLVTVGAFLMVAYDKMVKGNKSSATSTLSNAILGLYTIGVILILTGVIGWYMMVKCDSCDIISLSSKSFLGFNLALFITVAILATIVYTSDEMDADSKTYPLAAMIAGYIVTAICLTIIALLFLEKWKTSDHGSRGENKKTSSKQDKKRREEEEKDLPLEISIADDLDNLEDLLDNDLGPTVKDLTNKISDKLIECKKQGSAKCDEVKDEIANLKGDYNRHKKDGQEIVKYIQDARTHLKELKPSSKWLEKTGRESRFETIVKGAEKILTSQPSSEQPQQPPALLNILQSRPRQEGPPAAAPAASAAKPAAAADHGHDAHAGGH